MATGLYVITRSGSKEPCRFDKITDRITSLAYGLHELVDPVRGPNTAPTPAPRRAPGPRLHPQPRQHTRRYRRTGCPASAGARALCSTPTQLAQTAYHTCARTAQVVVAQKVCAGVYKGVTTTELDELAAETAAGMTSLHPDYAVVRAPAVCADWATTGALHRSGCASAVALPQLACRAACPAAHGRARGGGHRRREGRARGVAFPRRFSTCQPARSRRPARPDSPPPQLAARIAVASLHKTTSDSFTSTCVRRAGPPRVCVAACQPPASRADPACTTLLCDPTASRCCSTTSTRAAACARPSSLRTCTRCACQPHHRTLPRFLRLSAPGAVASTLSNHLLAQAVMDNAERLDAAMDYSRDYDYDYFGFKVRDSAVPLAVCGRLLRRAGC